jgi:enterochelin esterase-like enzyme
LAFYVGESEDLFRDENEQLDLELRRAHVAHVFEEYPGGHGTSLLTAHATAWLELALRHMRPVR